MISILMPVKNADAFLHECLESIVNQTFEKWELIAVNDHSTDQSRTILDDFASKDERIRVVENNGKGIIDALSLAYSTVQFNTITRMDADDKMHQKKLELLFDALKGKDNVVATAKVKYFAEGGIGEGYKKYQDWLNSLVDTNSHYAHIYKECVIPSPCWMTSKSVLDKIGGFQNLEYPEDYDLCFKLYSASTTVQPVNETLHYWRDYSSRTSRNDPNYADNTFIHLKVKHFIAIDFQPNLPLILWGAGKKGKLIAQLLAQKGISFRWFTNNPKKIGHVISNVELEDAEKIAINENQQVIFAIAEKEADNLTSRFSDSSKVYSFC